jgi:hypothetical protein
MNDFAVVYPNPTSGSFKIDLNLMGQEDVSIEVFDAIGNKVMDFGPVKMQPGYQTFVSENEMANSSNLLPGIYLLKITTNSQQQCTKIVVN